MQIIVTKTILIASSMLNSKYVIKNFIIYARDKETTNPNTANTHPLNLLGGSIYWSLKSPTSTRLQKHNAAIC